ncbi:NUDIX domain-containing protein [Candidatus Saccharibacteria bacterium]|nr:NUDIX domain-containing protein [Candidatus Saccharibacteria bacterium]MCL1962728.1 NUDIX domain-containing protein [Candidatus Saccharibacteria bacterium]
MSAERATYRASVYAILEKDGKILMLRRYNTGWSDGKYTLPSGHVDADESTLEAVLRELFEEVGVEAQPDDAEFVHVMHRIGDPSYFDFFYRINKWSGEPRIMEIDKCDGLLWIDINNPDTIPVLECVKFALEHIANGIMISSQKR